VQHCKRAPSNRLAARWAIASRLDDDAARLMAKMPGFTNAPGDAEDLPALPDIEQLPTLGLNLHVRPLPGIPFLPMQYVCSSG
jgi:hypothetical protein